MVWRRGVGGGGGKRSHVRASGCRAGDEGAVHMGGGILPMQGGWLAW